MHVEINPSQKITEPPVVPEDNVVQGEAVQHLKALAIGYNSREEKKKLCILK